MRFYSHHFHRDRNIPETTISSQTMDFPSTKLWDLPPYRPTDLATDLQTHEQTDSGILKLLQHLSITRKYFHFPRNIHPHFIRISDVSSSHRHACARRDMPSRISPIIDGNFEIMRCAKTTEKRWGLRKSMKA